MKKRPASPPFKKTMKTESEREERTERQTDWKLSVRRFDLNRSNFLGTFRSQNSQFFTISEENFLSLSLHSFVRPLTFIQVKILHFTTRGETRSVTRWLDFFNIWPFATMKISPIMSQICQSMWWSSWVVKLKTSRTVILTFPNGECSLT